jgi:hypothetical protein
VEYGQRQVLGIVCREHYWEPVIISGGYWSGNAETREMDTAEVGSKKQREYGSKQEYGKILRKW